MTLERGFRRMVLGSSLTALACGLAFSIVLAVACFGAFRLEWKRQAMLAAEGCPSDNEPLVTEVTSKALGNRRWRVSIPRGQYTYDSVVIAERDLSPDEVLKAAQSVPSAAELGRGRRRPMPAIEVVDCIMESKEIAAAQAEALSNRVIGWWMKRPGVVWSMTWLAVPGLGDRHPWLVVPAIVISPLILWGAVAAIPWALFYPIRWIARGFSG
jgi:hypothetical protein